MFNETKEPLQLKEISENHKKSNFFIFILKTMSYSWIVAPLFIDAGSMGGIQVPVIGALYLVPVVGWFAAFFTIISHPILLISAWFVFSLYLAGMITISRKFTSKKLLQFFIVIIAYIPYWFLAKIILNYLLK